MDTDYLRTIDSFRFRYPYIIRLKDAIQRHWRPGAARVTVLEFWSNCVKTEPLRDTHGLREYLRETASSACKHRLYLVEDLDEDAVSTLGSHFSIDPFVFAAQAYTSFWAESTAVGFPNRISVPEDIENFDNEAVVSETAPRYGAASSTTFRYLEVGILETSNQIPRSYKTRDNVSREIRWDKYAVQGGKDKADSLSFYLRRQATFWRKPSPGGWDAIIFTEPQIEFKHMNPSNSYEPYQHGYCDVAPWSDSLHDINPTLAIQGPDRKNLSRALVFYWTKIASEREIKRALQDPEYCGVYLERIVIGWWQVALEYLWKKVSQVEREVWAFEERWYPDRKAFFKLRHGIAKASEWRRKLNWIIYWLDRTEDLHVSGPRRHGSRTARRKTSEGSDHGAVRNDDSRTFDLEALLQKDLKVVKERLRHMHSDLDSTLNVITSMAQTLQGSVSASEAELASGLSLAALVFVPLAFTSGIFSMGGDFLPGERFFWVYFVVAVPFTLIILAMWRWTNWMKGGLLKVGSKTDEDM